MEKYIELLCAKFEKNEKLIEVMVKDTLQDGYNIKETVEVIEDFYNLKSMQ
jgi:hypothetical protein